jgi:hypothetical protein
MLVAKEAEAGRQGGWEVAGSWELGKFPGLATAARLAPVGRKTSCPLERRGGTQLAK